MLHSNSRRERISRLRGRAQELEAKLEGLSNSLLLKPGLYMAMSDREAEAPNELSMQKFQSLRVIIAYSDGWGHCVNEDTGEEGIVPLSCLKSMDGFQVSELSESDHTLVKEKKLLKKLSISDDILVKEPGIYTCVQDRVAERVNEISLEKGDEVRVLMVFSDGWGLCLDEITGEQGIAPLNILKLQGLDLDSLKEKTHHSSTTAGYYRVLVDRIPIQANEVLLLKGNVVQVSTIYSDDWCHCLNIDTLEAGDCPFNVLEWIEDQSLSKHLIHRGDEGIHGTVNHKGYVLETAFNHKLQLNFHSEKAELLHPIMEVINELESDVLVDTKEESSQVPQDNTIVEEKTVTSIKRVETQILEHFSVSQESSQVTESIAANSVSQSLNFVTELHDNADTHHPIVEVTENNEIEPLQEKEEAHSSVEESKPSLLKHIETITQSVVETEINEVLIADHHPHMTEIDSNHEKMVVEEVSAPATTQKFSITDNHGESINMQDDQVEEVELSDSKLPSGFEQMTTETITTITSHTKEITVFSAAMDDINIMSEHSMKGMETFNGETDSDITLSHSPSFDKSHPQPSQKEETIFDSHNAVILANGLKFIEIKSSATLVPRHVAANKKSFRSKIKEKLPQDSHDVISILRLIRMISIFLLAVQFLGFVSYSLVNAFLIMQNRIASLMPLTFTAHDVYIWLKYIFIDILEIDRFPVVAGNTLALIALIATVWEGVLIGFVNQLMVE